MQCSPRKLREDTIFCFVVREDILRISLSTIISLLAASFMLTACVDPILSTPDNVNNTYKLSAKPPVGYGRIYVVPAEGKNYSENSYVITGRVFVSKAGGKQAFVGSVSEDHFVAFDTTPGDILIRTECPQYTPSEDTFHIADGETLVLKPVNHLDAVAFAGGSFGLVGVLTASAVNSTFDTGSAYGVLDTKSLPQKLMGKDLTLISHDAKKYVKQGD